MSVALQVVQRKEIPSLAIGRRGKQMSAAALLYGNQMNLGDEVSREFELGKVDRLDSRLKDPAPISGGSSKDPDARDRVARRTDYGISSTYYPYWRSVSRIRGSVTHANDTDRAVTLHTGLATFS